MNSTPSPRSAAVRMLFLILALGVAPIGCNRSEPDVSEPAADSGDGSRDARQDVEPAASGTESSQASSSTPAEKLNAWKLEHWQRDGLQLATLPETQLREGWISLFDGQTLFGWIPNSDANWHVADGAIVVSEGEPGLLCTTSRFRDYVLKLEFKSDPGTNSGIFLRTPFEPKDPAGDCYELNIAPADNPFPTGSLVKRSKVEGEFQSDDWQTYQVTVEGAKVAVALNGDTILEYTDPDPLPAGHIGLQLNEGPVAFRNIQLRPLNLQSIFNGEDLTGWKTYPEMDSEFSVEEGVLRVRDGRGQLETAESYGDFILQLEAKTHAENLNSGIFFRCIPGETMNGYESQIHNGFLNSNRQQPVDCGTGGIFRRENARIVAADDNQWLHKTLLAQGDHFAIWVNGMQVTDWTDPRQPDPNPRRGLRLEPGTIMIQGHDPTTDLSFRNLRIKTL